MIRPYPPSMTPLTCPNLSKTSRLAFYSHLTTYWPILLHFPPTQSPAIRSVAAKAVLTSDFDILSSLVQ